MDILVSIAYMLVVSLTLLLCAASVIFWRMMAEAERSMEQSPTLGESRYWRRRFHRLRDRYGVIVKTIVIVGLIPEAILVYSLH